MTWFKKDKEINWVNAKQRSEIISMAQKLVQVIGNKKFIKMRIFYLFRPLVLIIGLLFHNSCNNQPETKKEKKEEPKPVSLRSTDYDLLKPVKGWALSDSLAEISGITFLRNERLIAIEDLHPSYMSLNLVTAPGLLLISLNSGRLIKKNLILKISLRSVIPFMHCGVMVPYLKLRSKRKGYFGKNENMA
jgi:hypothetical protein